MKTRSRTCITAAEFSDDEINNNNREVFNPEKKPSSSSYVHIMGLFFSMLFSLFCAIYACYTVSQLIAFLSSNACGILNLAGKTINTSLQSLVVTDIGLLGLFITQHAVMATETYKYYCSKLIPSHLHRSIYVLFTSLSLQVMMSLWINTLHLFIWDFNSSQAFILFCQVLQLIGWIHTFSVTYMIDFAEFLGLKQVYYKANNLGCPLSRKSPQAQRLFSHFRHPTVSGLMIILWCVPSLTLDRLLLALAFTIFLFSTNLDNQDAMYVQKMFTSKKKALKLYFKS